jgi:hypothetical protein
MGCPTPKIVNNGDGSALMKNPKLAGEIISAIKKRVSVPVSAKFRKGWDSGSVNAVDFAKHSGANVISITDSAMSPIAPQADQLLLAKSDMASFVDSLVAPLSIINAIIVAVARKKQDELTVRLRQLEQIWDEYDVYDKNQG